MLQLLMQVSVFVPLQYCLCTPTNTYPVMCNDSPFSYTCVLSLALRYGTWSWAKNLNNIKRNIPENHVSKIKLLDKKMVFLFLVKLVTAKFRIHSILRMPRLASFNRQSFIIFLANYLGIMFLPVFNCCNLCSDLFILVLCVLAFSAIVSAFQSFTHMNCLHILRLVMCSDIWNWFPIKNFN